MAISGYASPALTKHVFNHHHAPTLSRAAQVHRQIIILVLPLILGLQTFFGSADLFNFPMLAGLLVLTLGVPHGAFDVAIIRHRWPTTRPFQLSLVLAKYLALGGSVVVCWLFAPGLSLAAFLVIAAYHFGGDWAQFRTTSSRLVTGGALLSATAVFHQEQVGALFSLLAPLSAADWLARALHELAAPLLIVATVVAVWCSQKSTTAAIEYGLILTTALVLPPLTFFVVYFCLIHSVRHTLAVRQELWQMPLLVVISKAVPYAALAIVGTVAVGLFIARSGVALDMLSTVFIALAALTVPHMILVDHA